MISGLRNFVPLEQMQVGGGGGVAVGGWARGWAGRFSVRGSRKGGLAEAVRLRRWRVAV